MTNPENGHAQELLRSHWDLAGVLERLPGENLNFRVTTPEQDQMVLKISLEPHADIPLEEAMVDHLDAAGFPVPISIPTITGHRAVEAQLPHGRSHIRLQRHLPGTPWGDNRQSTDLLDSIGRSLATMHHALDTFSHDNAARSHAWDLSLAMQHHAGLDHIESPRHRRILEHCFLLHAAVTTPLLSQCPHGMLHGDFNDENILVDDEGITGLLDFGDCLYGPLIQDLAVALAYTLERTDGSIEEARALIDGYERIRALTDTEQTVLFPLAMMRLAIYVVTDASMRSDGGTDGMRNSHVDTAWAVLEDAAERTPEAARAAICRNCHIQHAPATSSESVHALRDRHISTALSLNFKRPLHITSGRGQYLHAADGRPYLDLVNNVCHVGHCHPHVVDAITRQASVLNTNTRYLHELLGEYASRLCSTMPESLDTCFLVNSGSEANELALRLARTATGGNDAIVIDGAYHGHTANCIAMSPYKFNGPGGPGPSDWVHVVPTPDIYRGPYQDDDAGAAHALDVADRIGSLCAQGRSIAGFFAEPILSCGGQVPLPPGYLAATYEHVRRAGGVCIADEVQVGFGRLGSTFWGFQLHDVVPDIVVLGKPIGNGHPMGAVITTRAVAEAFENGMEFFSTFGGNPVSCACGLAVLDVIEQEQLQHHAKAAGEHFLQGLRALQSRHPLIGDVRGCGLFIGIELVRDRSTLEPADREAADIVDAMCSRGVLMSTDGPLHNVIKIKPPMVLTINDIDMTLRLLDDVLHELTPSS
jgi:4-aminobutyrate aminotransferase-like enzyme/Ser/Thr protein kinase RdoA (MazF antagonist)